MNFSPSFAGSHGDRTEKSIRTSALFPADAYTLVQALAESDDMSIAWGVRHTIQKFLDNHGDQTVLLLRLPKAGKAREE